MAWPQDVTRADLSITYYKGSGPGGQNKNKRDTACRIVHAPTGLWATSETHRTQPQNKTEAFRRLAKKLVPIMKGDKKGPGLPTERIRTYHEKRGVTDTRVPGRTFEYKRVLDGDLDEILNELMEAR